MPTTTTRFRVTSRSRQTVTVTAWGTSLTHFPTTPLSQATATTMASATTAMTAYRGQTRIRLTWTRMAAVTRARRPRRRWATNYEDAFPGIKESTDRDGDGIGDNGDRFPDPNESTDGDDDSVGDRADNCPGVSNPALADLDGDGEGDSCDSDVDADGVPNQEDNAPRHANADQADLDGDGLGRRDRRDTAPRDSRRLPRSRLDPLLPRECAVQKPR